MVGLDIFTFYIFMVSWLQCITNIIHIFILHGGKSKCRGVINIIFANDKFVKGENRKNFMSANIYSRTVSS